MNIKTVMCKILANRRKEMKLTYDTIQENTDLSRSQLSYIFCHEGKGVSLENIEILAEYMGVEFSLSAIENNDENWGNS